MKRGAAWRSAPGSEHEAAVRFNRSASISSKTSRRSRSTHSRRALDCGRSNPSHARFLSRCPGGCRSCLAWKTRSDRVSRVLLAGVWHRNISTERNGENYLGRRWRWPSAFISTAQARSGGGISSWYRTRTALVASPFHACALPRCFRRRAAQISHVKCSARRWNVSRRDVSPLLQRTVPGRADSHLSTFSPGSIVALPRARAVGVPLARRSKVQSKRRRS